MAFYNNNNQQNPFWDFVASMEAQGSRPPSYAPRDGQPATEQAQEKPTTDNQGKDKQASVQDEVMNEAAPAAEKASAADKEKAGGEESSDEDRRGRGGPWGAWGQGGPYCHGRHRGGRRGDFEAGFPFGGARGGFGGFPGFMAPFFDGPMGPRHGPHGHHHHRHGPAPPQEPPAPPAPPGFEGPRGPSAGPSGEHERRGRHGPGGFGRRGGRGPFGGRRGPPFANRDDFNLPAFLSNLSERVGIDINAAAANYGVDLSRLSGHNNRSETDFTPSHDLFNLPSEYLIHVSLAGASKQDIGLDYDGESNTLRVGGVVYRPDVDESTTAAIAHDGRKSQIGVFETKIRLSNTKKRENEEETTVDVNAINAKLREGVLVIHVPKIAKKPAEKKSIRIESNSPPRSIPVREKERDNTFTKDNTVRFDGEKKEKEKVPSPSQTELDMYEATPDLREKSETVRGDDDEVMHDGGEHSQNMPPNYGVAEPEYHEREDDDEEEEEEGEEGEDEGEYVKINVD